MRPLKERTKRGIVGGLATAFVMITASVIYLVTIGASVLGILFVVALELIGGPARISLDDAFHRNAARARSIG